MIVGDMKVVKDYDDDTFYCYNLTKDIGESKDLKHLQKSTAQKLNAKLEKYLNDVKASIPTKNRNYNPSAKQSRNRFITRFDKDGDAKVSESEFKGPSRRFKDIDKNGDGFVDESEAPNRGRK